MFADEARFGRMNRPRPCWAPTGVRSEVAAQLIREYIYLYGAVCPKDGKVVDEFEDGDGLLGSPVGRDREWDGVLESGDMRMRAPRRRRGFFALDLAIIFLLGVAWRAVRFVRGLP
jgi:hypothetical protein